jgi:hypothetical protein
VTLCAVLRSGRALRPAHALGDPNRISFLVTGVYKFRVGVRRSGSTDTITSADLSLRKDGVNA